MGCGLVVVWASQCAVLISGRWVNDLLCFNGKHDKDFFFFLGIGSVWLFGLWFDGVRNTAEIYFIFIFMKVDLLALIPN